MRVATIELETDGLTVTARTKEVWEGEPLTQTESTAWGALHGLAHQLEQMAKQKKNPGAIVAAVQRVVSDPNLHSQRAHEAIARIRKHVEGFQDEDD